MENKFIYVCLFMMDRLCSDVIVFLGTITTLYSCIHHSRPTQQNIISWPRGSLGNHTFLYFGLSCHLWSIFFYIYLICIEQGALSLLCNCLLCHRVDTLIVWSVFIIFTILYVCMFVCLYVCMFVCLYVCTFVCLYVYMFICLYVCIICYLWMDGFMDH